MDRLLTEEELKKIMSTDGIIELLCDIPNFSAEIYEELDSEKRNLIYYTMNIKLITGSQVRCNLRRSMDSSNLALINEKVMTALALLYFGIKDESGKYIKYICPYTGKEFELEEVRKELTKPYKERKLDKILELEHIIPHSSNGGTILLNCIPASREANSKSEKGNLHLLDWLTNLEASGYKYYEKGGEDRLISLTNYIISAYEISFEEYVESEIDFYDNYTIAEEDGIDNDEDLENERKTGVSKNRIRETSIEGYIPFLNQLIEQLEKSGYDVNEFRSRLKQLEEKGIVNNLKKYTIVQDTIEKLFKQEDSKSYLTYSLNVDYIKLVDSIKSNEPEEIKQILTSRFEQVKHLIKSTGKSINDYFISLRDIQDVDLLYSNNVNEEDIELFINNIRLGYNRKIDLFIEMMSEDEYTGYEKGKPNKNNIFTTVNQIPFKGYETIKGLSTKYFWGSNSERIKEILKNQMNALKSKEKVTEEEQKKISKLQKAETAIKCYEFYVQSNLEKKIECYIEMLSEDEYTGYEKGKPNKKNIFASVNQIPFKGYETIKGLNTSHFWSNNSETIKTRIENRIKELTSNERLTENEQSELEKLQKAKRAIKCYEFYSKKDMRIECYIEMLSEDKYTGYENGKPNKNNIFSTVNQIPFKGYEDIDILNTSQFWNGNSETIKTKIENRIKELTSKEKLIEEDFLRLQKLKKAEKAIECYEFYSKIDKRIECYIEMLSEDEYTGYENGKPNKNNIFASVNKIPFKGYETIKGLNTRCFWSHNSETIRTKIENRIKELTSKERLTEEENVKLNKLKKAKRAIDCYEFTCNLDRRIECYIEMLSEDEYTGYENGKPNKNNIFSYANQIPFKGYETIKGLNTRCFWSHNSETIRTKIENRIKELTSKERLTEEENVKLNKLKKAERTIDCYEFTCNLDRKIDCYIEMLSEDKYTGYENGKLNKNNIFSTVNQIPFKGYETIKGLNTRCFWSHNSETIKAKIENRIKELTSKERLTEEDFLRLQKLKKAEKAIECYEFYSKIDKRIECYIEMLSEDEYTGYENGMPNKNNIFTTVNQIPFKGYEIIEGLNTSYYWNVNSNEIKQRFESQIKELINKEQLTEEEKVKLEKLKKVERAIDCYEFTCNLDRRIDCYIEMLSNDEYTGYEVLENGRLGPNKKNIFTFEIGVEYKGYETIKGLNTSRLWSKYNDRIKQKIEIQIIELTRKKQLTEKESIKLDKLQKAKGAIEFYEFLSDLNKRIECYIEMLSEDEYTGYEKGKPNKKNIFASVNQISFKGYEDIDRLNTSYFWNKNSETIKTKIENRIKELTNKERLTEEENVKLNKLKKAKRAIDCYEFTCILDRRIDCYIEMLAEEEYTKYEKGVPNKKNIFGQKNKVPFKGYETIEGLNTSHFWSNNSIRIISILFYNKDDNGNALEKNYSGPEYDKARKAILEYAKVENIEEYIEKIKDENKRNSLISLRNNASDITMSEVTRAGIIIRNILSQDREALFNVTFRQ